MIAPLFQCPSGALAAPLIALLSRRKSDFAAGLAPLVPAPVLIGHAIVGSERGAAGLRTTSLFGPRALVPYAVYLLMVFWFSLRLTLTATPASAPWPGWWRSVRCCGTAFPRWSTESGRHRIPALSPGPSRRAYF